jgi:hypothetical protein
LLRRPNQKQGDLFNPFSTPSLENCGAASCLFGRERFFPVFFRYSFIVDFDVPKETIENAKCFIVQLVSEKKVSS